MTAAVPEAQTYGGILVNAKGEVLLREPAGHFGGYAWTFAKGRPKAAETPEQTALRSVRVETGYNAKIIAPIPTIFRGTTSTTAFYLVGPIGRRRKIGKETANTRWVGFDEARELISKTESAEGRRRDWEALQAAKEIFDKLPYTGRPATCKDDWKTHPLPRLRKRIALDLIYDDNAMARITRGFLPAAMEDKWFAWFEEPILHFHRSWTGFCLYQVNFVREREGWRAAFAFVNRNAKQYGCEDDEEDRRLIPNLIDSLLVNGPTEPTADGFVAALTAATQPNYLGSPEVVSGLIQRVISARVDHAGKAISHEDEARIRHEVCNAFCDDAAGFTRIPGWHNREALGSAVVAAFDLDPSYCEGEDLYFVVSEAMAALSQHVRHLLKDFTADSGATWERNALPQLNDIHRFVVSVFLGTNDVAFPDRSLKDFLRKHTGSMQ